MKLTIVLLLSVLAFVYGRPDEKYTTKYDNIDLDEIIKNERLIKSYVDCLLDKGRCSPDGAELKKVLPDSLLTECSKCSEKQKNGSRKIIRHLIKNKPDVWSELEAKYDPQGTYKKKYDEELKKTIS